MADLVTKTTGRGSFVQGCLYTSSTSYSIYYSTPTAVVPRSLPSLLWSCAYCGNDKSARNTKCHGCGATLGAPRRT